MDTVTGAFGYIGKYIARALLRRGRAVQTITTHPNKPNPFGNAVQAFPYNFTNPGALAETLLGTETLYNTYWVRFPFDGHTFESAIANTEILFNVCAQAGVKRIVHVSVTNASTESPLPYYRGKAIQESLLKGSGVPCSIVRPTLVFGSEDILVNNIAWLLRTSPLFPVFGTGAYRVQPVFVEDLAEIAIQQSTERPGQIIDAIGPETYTFEELVRAIANALGKKPALVHVPPIAGIFCGKILGLFLKDVLLTRNELKGLMSEMLTSRQPPNASTRFKEWLEQNKDTVGDHYSSEIARHFRWKP